MSAGSNEVKGLRTEDRLKAGQHTVKEHEAQTQESNRCVRCGEDISSASEPRGDKRPKPGDISMCLYCGELMVFTDALFLREVTREEFESWPAEARAEIASIEAARRAVMERREKKSLLTSSPTQIGGGR